MLSGAFASLRRTSVGRCICTARSPFIEMFLLEEELKGKAKASSKLHKLKLGIVAAVNQWRGNVAEQLCIDLLEKDESTWPTPELGPLGFARKVGKQPPEHNPPGESWDVYATTPDERKRVLFEVKFSMRYCTSGGNVRKVYGKKGRYLVAVFFSSRFQSPTAELFCFSGSTLKEAHTKARPAPYILATSAESTPEFAGVGAKISNIEQCLTSMRADAMYHRTIPVEETFPTTGMSGHMHRKDKIQLQKRGWDLCERLRFALA